MHGKSILQIEESFQDLKYHYCFLVFVIELVFVLYLGNRYFGIYFQTTNIPLNNIEKLFKTGFMRFWNSLKHEISFSLTT